MDDGAAVKAAAAPQRHGSGSAEPRSADGDEDSPAADRLPEDELATGDVRADSGEEGTVEDRPAAVERLVPSAFGLTFAIGPETTELLVDARWGAYVNATCAGEAL